MPTKNTDHIFVVSDTPDKGHFQCNHCGEKSDYQLPLSVDAWVKQSRKFTNNHKNCKPAVRLAEM